MEKPPGRNTRDHRPHWSRPYRAHAHPPHRCSWRGPPRRRYSAPSRTSTRKTLGIGHALSVDVLFTARPEALIIAATTDAHPALVERAVAADIPVLCEKPLAASTAATQALIDVIHTHRGTVQIGHQRRFDQGHQQAKAAFHSGTLGWLHSFHATTADMRPPALEFLATGAVIHLRTRA